MQKKKHGAIESTQNRNKKTKNKNKNKNVKTQQNCKNNIAKKHMDTHTHTFKNFRNDGY